MWRKVLWLLPLSVAVPWTLYSTPDWWSRVTAAISAVTGERGEARASVASLSPLPSPTATADSSSKASAATGPPAVTDEPIVSMAEALSFDRSISWMLGRWPRVSAGLAQLQLQGYRVPLVTGTAEDDLAGSLTYYVNLRQELQKITFQGTTGDVRKLVTLLGDRYHFTRRLTNDPSSFVYEAPDDDRKSKSILWVRPARVLRAEDPRQRFYLSLVLERPEGEGSRQLAVGSGQWAVGGRVGSTAFASAFRPTTIGRASGTLPINPRLTEHWGRPPPAVRWPRPRGTIRPARREIARRRSTTAGR
jgi:hypothetical protein